MKNKKLWARIGAILACVLLLGALAIPCFAASDHPVNWPPSSDFKQYFYNVFLDDDMKVRSLDKLMDYMGDSFYNTSVLLSGTVSTIANPTNFDDYFTTSMFSSSFIARYSFYYNDQEVITDVGLLQVTFAEDTAVVSLCDVNYNPLISFGYSLTIDSNGCNAVLASITDQRNSQIYSLSGVSHLTIAIQSENSLSLMANLSQILYGVDSHWVCPREYYYGFSDGFDVGAQISYDLGYNDALNEIDSGEFGRNLLGSAFSAPVDALREFTLIEWTTDSGVEISVDLLTVFSAFVGVSLFVWFLKLFVGG